MTAKLTEDFKGWVKEPVQKEFKNFKPFGPKILIRLYYYKPNYKSSKVKIYKDLTSEELAQEELDSRLLPIGKVLALGNGVSKEYEELKPGDLVYVSDMMTGSKVNKEWVEYQALALEKPGIKEKLEEPPMFIGYISQWKDYVFMKDKTGASPSMDDAYTFLLPERYILGKHEQN